MKIQPRKRFGQHFLIDPSIISRIVDVFHPKPDENIIEIGPGLGAITLPLLKRISTLTVIEIDRDVIQALKEKTAQYPGLTIIQQDALTVDLHDIHPEEHLRIIGNLPYNISTPILFHLLAQKHLIHDMLFMLQKEVAERLCADINTKNYGRLSIMMQNDFNISILFDVPRSAFHPAPRVDSSMVYFTPHHDKKYGKIKENTLFSMIVKQAFQHKRKTLRNALDGLITVEMLEACEINPSARPAELSIADYITLANYYFQKEK